MIKKISRHYSVEHLANSTFETRVAIYEDQVRGWFHDQARILENNSDDAGFVLLLVALAYVEGYAIFKKGEDSQGNACEFFKEGFKDIFDLRESPPDIREKAIQSIWDEVRCGLFHTGMIRGNFILSRFNLPVEAFPDSTGQNVGRIQIDPHEMLNTVEAHLSAYVTKLRDPTQEELRSNFDKAWNLRVSSTAKRANRRKPGKSKRADVKVQRG